MQAAVLNVHLHRRQKCRPYCDSADARDHAAGAVTANDRVKRRSGKAE